MSGERFQKKIILSNSKSKAVNCLSCFSQSSSKKMKKTHFTERLETFWALQTKLETNLELSNYNTKHNYNFKYHNKKLF